MWIHEVLAEEIERLDAPVFGVLGDGNLFIVEALERRHPGVYVGMSNESGTVQAASGWAQRAGRVGVATVTHGPGLTNTVTALVEGVRAHTPVVLLAGETATDDPGNLQRIDQRALVTATGALFLRLGAGDHPGELVRSAHELAADRRTPVVLSIPYDLQWDRADAPPAPTSGPRRTTRSLDAEAVTAAAHALASAERPAILAGRGAVDADVERELVEIARLVGAVTLTSLRGKGLFEGQPFHLGLAGGLGDPIAMARLAECDVVLAVGVGLNPLTTNSGAALCGQVIRIDRDEESAGPDVLTADARDAVPALLAELDRHVSTPRSAPAPFFPTPVASGPALASAIPITEAVRLLEHAIPAERTLVLDGGRFFFEAARRLSVPCGRSYVHTASFAAIGMGMSAAIGAAHAVDGGPVLLVTGDGGFMLGGLAEFVTAVRTRLDLIVVVMNDNAYGAEVVQLEEHGLPTDVAQLDWPDLGPVACSLGGLGMTVRTSTELEAALAAIPGRDRPMLIDIHIAAEDIPWPFHKANPASHPARA